MQIIRIYSKIILDMKKIFSIATWLFCVIFSISAQQSRVTSFGLNEVRLLEGSKYRDNQRLDSAWICSLTVQRLLQSFRTTAGAWSALEGGYSGKTKVEKLGGWESLDCDLRGHAVGHLLSAYAIMYANTGSEIFKLKGDSLVSGICECQLLMGTGYISAFPDGLLKRNLCGTSVWAPWYTIHKIIAGLIMQYRLTGNETALQICKDFAAWTSQFVSDENLSHYIDASPQEAAASNGKRASSVDEVRQRALRNEFGGIGEAFYDLYAITGDAETLHCAQFFYHNDKVDPLYASNFDMGTQHCNTFLPKMAAEIKSYKYGAGLNPHAVDQSKNPYQMVDAFWHAMIHDHVLAPGCLSDKEHFFDPMTTSQHLTGNTGETCCTYNLLKITRELYSFNPYDPAYFDYYERALYNHILGQQDPETGMVHYFLPTQTGAYKLYSTFDKSFWCCVGSSFESHAKYAESIYWKTADADTLYVNLFIPSALQAEVIDIRMETDFPRSGKVSLHIQSDRKRVLMVRQPTWTGKSGYKAYKLNKGSKHLDIEFAMSLHTEATPDDSHRIALFYGPILLAGQLGTEGIGQGNPYDGCGFFSDPRKHNDYYGFDYQVPESLKSIDLDVKSIKQTGPLEWITSSGIVIKPLYDTHRQRYVTYWRIDN